jgi:hypothetical protein
VTPRAALRRAGALALALTAAYAAHGAPTAAAPEAAGYATRLDTLRERPVDARAEPSDERAALGALVPGYLSVGGLPPIGGALTVTDTGLVFRSADGRYIAALPMVGPVRASPKSRRATAVSLAYIDQARGRPVYLFRVDGGVFETEAPAALMAVAAHPPWLDSLRSREWAADRAIVPGADSAAVRDLLAATMRGGYADTLYALFGRPSRPVGLVGARGRAAGRLGEYVAARDSLALDPARMSSPAQLRHTLAHELAHRWQARSAAPLGTLWQGVPAIRDPKRYGYDNPGEHQAEAAAFAVHFLLATAAADPSSDALAMLDHYEVLVPGTRLLARFFAMQPVFHGHPLRRALTTGSA